jgi:hypothetical protein
MEIKEYKKDLINRIRNKISLLGTTIPTKQSGWDFKHSRQKR